MRVARSDRSPASAPDRSGDRTFSDPTLRLYAVVRADLGMPPGKMAAQAGHAFLDAYLAAAAADPARAAAYLADGHGAKVVLAAPDEFALRRLAAECSAARIPAALITDSGHVLPPHFNGDPIVTALGLGPATRKEVKRLTSRLNLVA